MFKVKLRETLWLGSLHLATLECVVALVLSKNHGRGK